MAEGVVAHQPALLFPLICEHTFAASIAPESGDLVWCKVCKEYRIVMPWKRGRLPLAP